MSKRRGVSTVEYVLLISVILVALLVAAYVFVPGFVGGVDEVADDVAELLGGDGASSTGDGPAVGPPGPSDGDGSDCPFTFDSRTGRWHDQGNDYLMVSFAEAADAGCS